jgi:hypothetical protein
VAKKKTKAPEIRAELDIKSVDEAQNRAFLGG